MRDERSTLERELRRLTPRPISFDQLARRRDRKRRDERIRAGIVGLAVVLAVAWLAFDAVRSPVRPAGQPTPSPSAGAVLRREGEILQSTQSRPDELLAVDPETGASRVIADAPGAITDARWSPDGTRAAYRTGRGGFLWVVDPTGERRLIATDVRMWTWSPTSASVAVVVGSDLRVVDPSTAVAVKVTRIVGDVTSAPVWSPDGRRIVFGARGGALYSVDVRNGDRSLLVQLPGDHLDSMDYILWSPDGTRIAVMNDLVPGDGRLYLLDEDGSDVHVVAENYQTNGIAWSPDGSRLAYADSSQPGELRVWVVPADGSPAALVASHTNGRCCLGGSPVWSPDGSTIAFEADGDTLRVDADGSGPVTLIARSTYERWSADSSSSCECY